MAARLAAALSLAPTCLCLWSIAAGAATTLANPASVYCEQRGGRVEIETVANGAERGICVLRSGTRIDEWAYFRNGHRTTH